MVSFRVGIARNGSIGMGWLTTAVDGTEKRSSKTPWDLDTQLVAFSIMAGELRAYGSNG